MPPVDSVQKDLGSEGLDFFQVKLSRPRHACGRISPRPGRFVFRESRCFFARRIAPVVPAFRLDMAIHPALDKHCPPVRPPWPSEVDAFACISPGQPAISKHKSIRLGIAQAPMRSHVALAFAVYCAVLKDCGSIAKNDIDVPLDITILVVLPAAVRKQSVLPAQKSTVTKCDSIGVDIHSNRLRAGPIRVLKRNVLGPKVTATNISAVRESGVA